MDTFEPIKIIEYTLQQGGYPNEAESNLLVSTTYESLPTGEQLKDEIRDGQVHQPLKTSLKQKRSVRNFLSKIGILK